MKFSTYLQALATCTFAPAIIATSLAQSESESDPGRARNVEIEIEPGGFVIESDGKVVEFEKGKSDPMSINLDEIFGQLAGGGLGEVIAKLVEAHPEQASKLAQSFLGGDLTDLAGKDHSSFSDLFSAGIEATPYFVGLVVDVPDDALLFQLDLPKGSALIVKEVVNDSPAAKAGFQKHDVLIAKDGTAFSSRDDLVSLVNTAGEAEKAVELIKISKGQRAEVSITPAMREDKNPFGTAFFGPGVVVPPAGAGDEGARAELKAMREELDAQRGILQSILSRLSDKPAEW